MYNVSLLREGFISRVGILDSNYPQIPKVQEPLSISLSGVNVQDKHPLLSLENIWYGAPDFDPNNWNLWVTGTGVYVVGDQVNSVGIIYICILNISGSTTAPASDATHWEEYFPFQVWLQQKYNQAVTNLFAEVVKRKKLQGLGKALLDKTQLYRGAGSRYNQILGNGSAVGFQISIQSSIGLLAIIEQIGIQVSESQVKIPIYLYNSSQDEYLAFWEIDSDAAYTFTWNRLVDEDDQLSCILRYLQYDTSSVYYIVYYQDDLTGNALSKDWDCQSPCIGCSGNDVQLFNLWSQYVTFRNIQIPPSGLDPDRNLFDTKKIIYNTNTNWGLNFNLSVRCDLTDTILDDGMLDNLSDAFSYQLAKEFLGCIAKNTRINPYNDKIQQIAEADLDPKYSGNWYTKEYLDAVESVNIDLSGFNKNCLPCSKSKKGLGWGTV